MISFKEYFYVNKFIGDNVDFISESILSALPEELSEEQFDYVLSEENISEMIFDVLDEVADYHHGLDNRYVTSGGATTLGMRHTKISSKRTTNPRMPRYSPRTNPFNQRISQKFTSRRRTKGSATPGLKSVNRNQSNQKTISAAGNAVRSINDRKASEAGTGSVSASVISGFKTVTDPITGVKKLVKVNQNI